MNSLAKRSFTGVAWAAVENWGRQILGFGIYALLARWVGPEAFGVVALAALYVALVEIFMRQGFGTAIIQRKELQPGHLDSAFWINLLIAVLLCLLSVAVAEPVGWFFDQPQFTPVMRWLSLTLVLVALSRIPTAILTREMSFRALALRALAATVCGGLVGLPLAWMGWGVWALVAQQITSASVAAAVLWWAVPWRPSPRVSLQRLRELYSFALSILGNNLLWFASQRFDQTLIGYRFGEALLGPYALASKSIYLLMDAVAAPVQQVALPAFSRLQDRRSELTRVFHRTTEMTALLVFPVFGGVILIAEDFVPLIFGAQWTVAVPFFQALAVYGALRTAVSFTHPLILSVGRPGLYLLMFVLLTGLTVGFAVWASNWSVVAIAYALSAALVLQSAVFLPVLRKVAGISLTATLGAIGRPLCLTGLMAAVVLGLRWATEGSLLLVPRMLLSMSAGAAVYSVLLLLLRPRMVGQIKALISSKLSGLETGE